MNDNATESLKVLIECMELQGSKGRDYQSDSSGVTQADYYVRGIDTLYDEMHKKMLRIRSLLHKARNGQTIPNHESIEDSLKDLINYASFSVAWLRKGIPGQDQDRDMFNQITNTDVNKVTTITHPSFKEALNNIPLKTGDFIPVTGESALGDLPVEKNGLVKPTKTKSSKKSQLKEVEDYMIGIVPPLPVTEKTEKNFSVLSLKDKLVTIPKNPIIFDNTNNEEVDVNAFVQSELDHLNNENNK